MAIYKDGIGFVEDLVSRTKEIYINLGNCTKYDVTMLINSAIGILVIPKGSQFIKISDSMIDNGLLEKMKNCVIKNTYSTQLNLSQLIRHLRNGIAHSNMDFTAEQPPLNSEPLIIHDITIKDKDNNGSEFEIKVTVDLLKEFFMKFSDAVIDYCKNQKTNKREVI